MWPPNYDRAVDPSFPTCLRRIEYAKAVVSPESALNEVELDLLGESRRHEMMALENPNQDSGSFSAMTFLCTRPLLTTAKRLPALTQPLRLRPFSSSSRINMKVVPVPVREDNYAYLLIDETTNKAAAVDPYTVSKVKAAADQLGVEIVAAITTHHHYDHSGGNEVRGYQNIYA